MLARPNSAEHQQFRSSKSTRADDYFSRRLDGDNLVLLLEYYSYCFLAFKEDLNRIKFLVIKIDQLDKEKNL